VETDFTPTTWQAFQRFGVDGVPAAQVAQELGLSQNAVILAKSRVLKRLRQEAGDLLGLVQVVRSQGNTFLDVRPCCSGHKGS
jgi:hypothetical protein